MAIKLLLAGYLGAGNFGDDALMTSLYHALDEREFEVRALSGNPDETYRHYRISSVPRRDMKAVEAAIKECDVLVFPGGSVFQDATSARSVLYYSTLVNKAKAARKKVVMLSQGIGPLTTFMGKRWARSAFNQTDVVCVRDPQSAQALRDLGVKTNIRVTADLSFIMPKTHDEDADGFNVGAMKSVGIAPKALGKNFDSAGLFGEFCKLLYQAGFMPVLIPMDRHEDMPLIEEISKRHGGRIPDLRKAQTPMQIQQRVARMEAMVAMRLHGGILAAGVGVPPLMVSYDPKVSAFARMLDIGPAIALEGLTPTRLLDTFTAFHKERPRNVKILERKREELYNLAYQNITILRETVGAAATI